MTGTAERPLAVPPGLAAGGLVIERVETLALRAPLARRFSGSAYSMDNRCTIVTRLTTSDGLTSEVYTGDTDVEQERIVGIIHDELAPAVIGRSATDPEGAWLAMDPSTNDILRDRGLALQAIACLDVAIWDLFGRALDLPLHRVWGSVTDSVPISVIGGYYHLTGDDLDPDDAELRGRRLLRGQVQGRRSQPGRGRRSRPGRPGSARPRDGPDGRRQPGLRPGPAVDFGRRVADLDIRWFEEPCRWSNDRRWMRDVRHQTGLAVCAGQSETTLRGMRDLMIDDAIDVSNFDASWSGGPTVWRKAAGMAAAFGVQLGHHEEPQVSSHLLASVPEHTFVECFDEERDPFFWNLTDMSTRIRDGRYHLPERPGFGIEFDLDYVAAHTIDRRVTTR